MTKFRSPKRREAKKESGFHVGGETKGSECKILYSKKLRFSGKSATVEFQSKSVGLVPLFNKKVGVLALGLYLNPEKDLEVNLRLSCRIGELEESRELSQNVKPCRWSKLGQYIFIDMSQGYTDATDVMGTLTLTTDKDSVGTIHFFGLSVGSVSYQYYQENDVHEVFTTKTELCVPEIYYFGMDNPVLTYPVDPEPEKFEEGKAVVLKSCNRCSRFLLIDVENERNLVSFGSHCVKNAPCEHNAFSLYTIESNSCTELPKYIEQKLEKPGLMQITLFGQGKPGKIRMHYGYQLECKACKKFYVNAPLNPMRDSTQHREDSLRRRAMEVLLVELLERDWIYHLFRTEKKKEFDKHIWRKFGKKCFKCGVLLPDCKDMHLDHTLPLAYLWPLDETATCLCKNCNSSKSDRFPVDFYSSQELDNLANITGLEKEVIQSRCINSLAVECLRERVDWFFDEFLIQDELQKVREGKKAADLILKAIQKVLEAKETGLNLVEEFRLKTGNYPKSVSF